MNERLLFSSYYLPDTRRSIAVLMLSVIIALPAVHAQDSRESGRDELFLLELYAMHGPYSEAYRIVWDMVSRSDQDELSAALTTLRRPVRGLSSHERLSLLRLLLERVHAVVTDHERVVPELEDALAPFLDAVSTYPSGLRATLLHIGMLFRNDEAWRLSLQREGHRLETLVRSTSGQIGSDEASGAVAWLRAVEALEDPVFLRITTYLELQTRHRRVVQAARDARVRLERSIDSLPGPD